MLNRILGRRFRAALHPRQRRWSTDTPLYQSEPNHGRAEATTLPPIKCRFLDVTPDTECTSVERHAVSVPQVIAVGQPNKELQPILLRVPGYPGPNSPSFTPLCSPAWLVQTMPTKPLTRGRPSQVETCTGTHSGEGCAGDTREAPSGQGNLGNTGWLSPTRDRESHAQ